MELTGKVAYCSGLPVSTHYMGQALVADEDGDSTDRMLLFVAPRDQFEIVDDWGRLVGLRVAAPTRSRLEQGTCPRIGLIEDAC